jgi:hypothetical protein
MTQDSQKCEASCKDGSSCGSWAVTGETKCRIHLGKSVDGSSHESNGHAERHGLKADRDKWFNRHREEVETLVRTLVASYIEDAPFGWESTAKVDKLCAVAVDQARLRESNNYLDDFLVEQTTAVTDAGEEVTRLEENPGHMPRDRIKRTNVKTLKELGILDDPDTTRADSVATLAEVIDK